MPDWSKLPLLVVSTRTRRRILALGLLMAGAVVYQALFKWGVTNSQERFLGAIEDKRWTRVGSFVSGDYGDRFEFDDARLIAAIRDFAGQFIFSLTIDWTELERRSAGNEVTLKGKIRLEGTGTPVAAAIVREASRYRERSVEFTWRRESIWPWSWRLVEVDLPGLDLPTGYEPGDLGIGSLDF